MISSIFLNQISYFFAKLFRTIYPDYRHRWEVYNERLCSFLRSDVVWLDIGCGSNEHVADFGHLAAAALGIDALDAGDRASAPFLHADLRSVPLPSGHADLITLRLVVEHLKTPHDDFSEVERLLKPGGTLIILTTNSQSPVVFLPRLLPFRVKTWLIQKSFGVSADDVFPTYHRFNTHRKLSRAIGHLKPVSVELLEQVPLHKPLLTIVFGLWYSLVSIVPLRGFRSNLLAVFQKEPCETTQT